MPPETRQQLRNLMGDDRHRYLRALWTRRQQKRNLILILLWAACAVFFWQWWLRPAHWATGVQFWVATLALAWLFYLQLFFVLVFRQAKVPAFGPPAPGSVRVAMIVTKTPSEPLSVLIPTLKAMLAQTYPHDTWLADEAPDAETRAWCDAHGVRISSRQGLAAYHQKTWPRRTRCKEGNLAYFYDTYGYEAYDFVSQLDADHVPTPTYLAEVLRGFADPRVGYVSAPSICAANANQSWAARTRLFTEAVFHGVFQAGYTASLSPMCIGSHYAVRTTALKEIGGLGPDLAEDHSTTMLMNAGGWRGVHAFDAIAYGDGPANIADLCTQEFQWSRSLVTLLLQHTPRYLRALSPRLKFLFLFCQLFYPLFAAFMTLFFLLPVAALVLDIRYANVTFPAFLAHITPQIIMLTAIAYYIKADGHLRPSDGKVIAWEKALFLSLQWPWAIWGCVMAVRDRFAGDFVDFRITPKGEAAKAQLPIRIITPYAAFAAISLLPVIFIRDVENAQGFYLFATINGILFTSIVGVIVFHHYKDTEFFTKRISVFDVAKIAIAPALVATTVLAAKERGTEGLYALSQGIEPYRLITEEYAVAGAGMGGPGTVILRFDPGLNRAGNSSHREERHGSD
ncbi:glycosyltransferase [Epibacterium sp. SM1979]|uniref:Glycosyltransferase n=1 Tax=Tritonibacter litoralis TaxID=2662264 RepID=A0A843YE45_9RHOB|nr:glycosyltransferase family 2 protein [Tritonibacter litoralis]MQQ09336.1 glycosyltransferase [Tritonibacter litoralis]